MTIELFAIIYISIIIVCVAEAYFTTTFKDNEE